MANYKKSFNLRNGVQVDDDNFIVNANGLVGIGTSIPTEFLDVRGNAKIVGHTTSNTLYAGIATITTLRTNEVISSGVITASSFSGNASGLTGIYAIAVDGWYVNLSNSSISTTSKVGIGTTNPQYSLQIGNPISGKGIHFSASSGDIYTNGNYNSTGVITATTFYGNLNASYLTGTASNSILPTNINVGIITASSGFYGNVTGNLTGTASTANSITSSANIQVNSINSGFSTSGISTVYTTLHVPGNIGVGTLNPNAQLHVRKSGISSVQLTSDGSNHSIITFGRSVSLTTNNAQLRFGNTDGTYSYSTEQSLDLINYDTGNFNFYLNPGGAGTGSYNWFKPSLGLIMTLTSSGNLGINSSNPSNRLSVVGNAHIAGVATVTGNLISGNLTASSVTSGSGTFNNKVGIFTGSPTYDLQVGNNPVSSSGVGISSAGDLKTSGEVASSKVTTTNIVASGIITSTGGFTSGTGSPVKISVAGSQITLTIPGFGSTVLTVY